MRYALTLSYDGIGFCGWQIQPSEPSVQEALQQALTTLLGRETAVTGAGRTDTDVHALQYVAHFDCEGPLPNESKDFLYKLNAILPAGVAVSSISAVSDSFHARFDATRRTYLYFIHFRKDPFVERYSWHCKFNLDVEKMNAACAHLLGTHDFSCFEKKGADSKTAICTIFDAHWDWYIPTLWEMSGTAGARVDGLGGRQPGELTAGRSDGLGGRQAARAGLGGDGLGGGPAAGLGGGQMAGGEQAGELAAGRSDGLGGGQAARAGLGGGQAARAGLGGGQMAGGEQAGELAAGRSDGQAAGAYLCFRISADRFLRNMVRAIVGTMVEVGRGRLAPEDIPAIIASQDRCRAGQSVPGNALFLASVEY